MLVHILFQIIKHERIIAISKTSHLFTDVDEFFWIFTQNFLMIMRFCKAPNKAFVYFNISNTHAIFGKINKSIFMFTKVDFLSFLKTVY